MVRASNGYWNFAYRDVKRRDARIERRLRNDATGTPNEVTDDGRGKEDDRYDNCQISRLP